MSSQPAWLVVDDTQAPSIFCAADDCAISSSKGSAIGSSPPGLVRGRQPAGLCYLLFQRIRHWLITTGLVCGRRPASLCYLLFQGLTPPLVCCHQPGPWQRTGPPDQSIATLQRMALLSWVVGLCHPLFQRLSNDFCSSGDLQMFHFNFVWELI